MNREIEKKTRLNRLKFEKLRRIVDNKKTTQHFIMNHLHDAAFKKGKGLSDLKGTMNT